LSNLTINDEKETILEAQELTSLFGVSSGVMCIEESQCKEGIKQKFPRVPEMKNYFPNNDSNNNALASQCTDRLLHTIDLIRRQLEENSDSKILVFVRMRKTAQALAKFLRDIAKIQNCDYVVGHAPLNGMNSNHQRSVVENFKNGNIKVIIATSVLEEGIDVPQCQLVLSFDSVTCLRAYIQVKGRARAKNSRYIIFIEKGTRSKVDQIVQEQITMWEKLWKEQDPQKEVERSQFLVACGIKTVEGNEQTELKRKITANDGAIKRQKV